MFLDSRFIRSGWGAVNTILTAWSVKHEYDIWGHVYEINQHLNIQPKFQSYFLWVFNSLKHKVETELYDDYNLNDGCNCVHCIFGYTEWKSVEVIED